MRRRLALSKETLTELRTDELTAVNGAAPPTGYRTQCAQDLASEVIECASILYPCITWTGCTTR